MSRFFKYLHTVRHLRPIQVAARLRRSLPRGLPSVSHDGVVLRGSHPVRPISNCDAWQGDGFRFLNQHVTFAGDGRWSPPEASRLWAYNLHYFRYLWSLPERRAGELIKDWLEENPPGSRPGWEPYPIALRLREWLEWLISKPDLEPAFRERVIASLDLQLSHLLGSIEYEHLANHLLEDAIGLCWAGLRLSSPSATVALRQGVSILKECLEEQILPDGSHDERSPMYQAAIAEALFRLSKVAEDSPRQELGSEVGSLASSAASRLVESMRVFCHPDGEIALLNDSVFGGAPEPHRLFAALGCDTATRSGVQVLPDAGYAAWNDNGGNYLVFDSGDIGPAHNTAHSHGDMLSFELSVRGERVVTDTGVYTYDPGPVRFRDRSTRAHNTLEIDGRDQAELWAAFRCARRGEAVRLRAGGGPAGFSFEGTVEYPGSGTSMIRHQRRIAGQVGRIEFEDFCESPGRHSAVLRLHLAPGIDVRELSDRQMEFSRHGMPVMRLTGGAWDVVDSPYHPRFGEETIRRCLTASWTFRDSTRIRWAFELLKDPS